MTGRAAIRAVAQDLQAAEAAKLARVVAMVDALASRGAADEVIAPLRPRLLALRPPRPLRLARLLFLPLDGVILPAAAWRRGSPAVPRSVLAPVATHLRALARPEVAAVEEAAAGATTADSARLLAAGQMLWPLAADRLMHAPPPADWAESAGLQPADFKAIIVNIATVLFCAAELHGIAAGQVANPQEALTALVGEAAARRPAGLPTLMAVLLAQWPDCTALLTATERVAGLRQASDAAIDFALGTIAAAPPLPPDMAAAELELRRAVLLLEACDGRTTQTIERSQRLRDLRQRFEQEARSSFDTALADLAEGDEARARDLRRFEATARRVGTRTNYDRALRDAVERLRPGSDDPARMDKLRLVEILAGPEVAFAML
jgi:hypothetical protein